MLIYKSQYNKKKLIKIYFILFLNFTIRYLIIL